MVRTVAAPGRATMLCGGAFDSDSESDFGDESTLAQIVDAFRKTPPLTNAYLFVVTCMAFWGEYTNNNNSSPMLQLEWMPCMRGWT